MKKTILLSVFTVLQLGLFAQTQQADTGISKKCFYAAFDSLKNMLEGKDSLNYEKAVFITENAYYDNAFNYADFEKTIDLNIACIDSIAQHGKQENEDKLLHLGLYKKNMLNLNITNCAIYNYMTDTIYFRHHDTLSYKPPFNYSSDDPYGSTNWENTQVLHLLNGSKGNCYALTALYKIFSDRLNGEARLVTAPHHIYLQVKNTIGDYWNVELTSKTFPGDGSIQTLTYTTHDLIMNGMAQQPLTDKQAVVLNLIYLAKSFEHKFKDNTSNFLLQCANLAFEQDTLSLNALLLKAEITENRLLVAMVKDNVTTVAKARTNHETKQLLADYEKQLTTLYQIGYVEVPKNIEEMILAAIEGKQEAAILTNNTPNPFAPIGQNQRYYTLSGGLFDEMHPKADTGEYFHALLNTKTKRIIAFTPLDTLGNNEVDPVVFALSVDPLAAMLPSYSPYAAFNDNPIFYTDPTGASAEGPPTGPGGCVFPDDETGSSVGGLAQVLNTTGTGGSNSTNTGTSSAGSSSTPLSTDKLRSMAIQKGWNENVSPQKFNWIVGKAFENTAIQALGLQLNANTKPFYSSERNNFTNGNVSYVVPDAVGRVFSSSGGDYPNSYFAEVKAISRNITLGTSNQQIRGLIDAAANSPAGRAQQNPSVFFITTANTIIGNDVVNAAQASGVQIWQIIAYVDDQGRIAFSQPVLQTNSTLTPESLYINTPWLELAYPTTGDTPGNPDPIRFDSGN